ncbi:unnamed protein product (macronuclear) [Paramecium tetraurelia]|uniref:Ubiquitin carboxyl-terminal hydrolase n=1 Tax=Paramecium tetraurelia TaxID=5888 RepID=A0D201_PARTE|nr:uncharacterized protein GSPATT00012574001 [Paramecium tetraurelia]CAK77068.1 unnamed protein product [Paramecium tetraurelia]|eukprot:XP_001444465.1 hypothetical protein (macronuclear) [Paramecium tetraurelia strain d4-2]
MYQSQQLHKPLDNDLIKEYTRNGYTEEEIRNAWEVTSGNMIQFQQMLWGMKNQSFIISPINQQFNDDIQVAVAASLSLHQKNIPDGKVRKENFPCGLLNVGNTCYFNSLLQTYYSIYNFVLPIVKCEFDHIDLQNIVDKRVANSVLLLKNLQNLFVLMIGSDRQFVDPKQVIHSIYDDFGKALPIGDQKDVGEFNNYFLSRIDEGMTYLNQSLLKSQQPNQEYQIAQSQVYPQKTNQHEQNKSFISQKSLLVRQSSVVAENSVLYKLFYGKFAPQLTVQGLGSKDCEEEIFNFIQIDVGNKFLMEGLEKNLNQVLEYKNEKDQYQQAIKSFWISQAPQILSFQIQRVEFHKEFLTFAKINSPFQFDKEIYIDRFLLSNQKIAREIQSQNQQMSDRLKKIDLELEQLNSFNGNIQIIQNLETTLQFLKLQTPNEKSNPYYVNSKDNKAAIDSISQYHQYFIQKRDSLLKEKKELESKISSSYNNLKKQKYILQSILMHEGSPDGGHYFAYIYDSDDKKWYLFNDIHVQEETEQNVFKYAFGDSLNSKSAYLIQYVKDEKPKQNQNQNFKQRLYSTSQNINNYLQDGYGKLLSQKQKDILHKDNLKLKQEVIQQQLIGQIEIIVSIYLQYFDNANEKQKLYQLKQYQQITYKPPYIENFAMFLKTKPDEKMFRWVILDYAIKKMIPQTNGIFGPPDLEQNLKTLILEEISKFGQNKPIQPIPQSQEYQTSLEEYKLTLKLLGMIAYILEQYNNNSLKETIIALHVYMKLAKLTNQQSFFYNMALQMKNLILLGIICKIYYQKNITDSEILVLKLLIAFQMQEHFLYKDPKQWSKQLLNLIGVALSTYGQNEKQTQDVVKPLVQSKKDVEMCALLDTPSQNIEYHIQSIWSIYLKKQFEDQFEDFLQDNLMVSLQTFYQIKCTSLLLEKITKSDSILDKKDIFKIIEENPQNK